MNPPSPENRASPTPDINISGSILWTAGNHVAPFVYTAVVSIVAARVLGPDKMGRQSFIAFVVLTMQTIFTTSLGLAVTREVGELLGRGAARASINRLIGEGWKAVAVGSLLASALMGIIAARGATPEAAWAFGALTVLFGGLNMLPGGVLVGARRWRIDSMGAVGTGLIGAVLAIAALAIGWGIVGMMAAMSIAAICRLSWNLFYLRRFFPRDHQNTTRRSEERPRSLLRIALQYAPAVILGFVVLQRSEMLFLNRFASNSEIAIYAIAFSLIVALAAAPTAVQTFVLPSVSALLGAEDHARIRRGFSRMVRMSLLVTIPLTAAAVALGPTLIRLLYGEDYSEAGTILVILLAQLPLVPLAAGGAALLMAYATKGRALLRVYGIAAAVDLSLALILVPRFEAAGAAAASVAAMVVLAVVLLRSCSEIVGGIAFGWAHLARLSLASAIAAGVSAATLTGHPGVGRLLLAAVIAAAVFAAALLVLRPLSSDDGAWLSRLATGRTSSMVRQTLARISAPSPDAAG
jgi:O-antigen/teichoic acid export membrane protein